VYFLSNKLSDKHTIVLSYSYRSTDLVTILKPCAFLCRSYLYRENGFPTTRIHASLELKHGFKTIVYFCWSKFVSDLILYRFQPVDSIRYWKELRIMSVLSRPITCPEYPLEKMERMECSIELNGDCIAGLIYVYQENPISVEQFSSGLDMSKQHLHSRRMDRENWRDGSVHLRFQALARVHLGWDPLILGFKISFCPNFKAD